MKHATIFISFFFLFAACAPVQATQTQTPDEPVTSETPSNPVIANPYAPQPGDGTLTRASAFINSADLLFMESFPVQVALILRGNLPTPCHSLRAVIHAPDQNNNIEVEIYSIADPNKVCEQVLQSFEASIPLGAFPSSHYTVWVNDDKVGEFDS